MSERRTSVNQAQLLDSNSHFDVARASSPASFKGVPPRDFQGGETPPKLAAGTAALRQSENCWLLELLDHKGRYESQNGCREGLGCRAALWQMLRKNRHAEVLCHEAEGLIQRGQGCASTKRQFKIGRIVNGERVLSGKRKRFSGGASTGFRVHGDGKLCEQRDGLARRRQRRAAFFSPRCKGRLRFPDANERPPKRLRPSRIPTEPQGPHRQTRRALANSAPVRRR